jgi:hypothetical protein
MTLKKSNEVLMPFYQRVQRVAHLIYPDTSAGYRASHTSKRPRCRSKGENIAFL